MNVVCECECVCGGGICVCRCGSKIFFLGVTCLSSQLI